MDVPEPQIMEGILEAVEITPKKYISERMHEQVVDEPVCQTFDQPGHQACRVPTDSKLRMW